MNELKILLQVHDIIENTTPNNFLSIKAEIIKAEAEKRNRKSNLFSTGFRMAIATFLFVVLAGSATVAAYKLSGADFFNMFYSKNDCLDDQVYMGSEQYNTIASSTVGTVVDTDEMKIEVLGVIASGKVSSIMLRVTAKQLDSVNYDNGIEPLKNYRFGEELSGNISDYYMSKIRYYHSDEIKELKPNQFQILYTIIGEEAYVGKQYTMELKDFGYFTSRADFVALYHNNWSFPIDFDMQPDYAKSIDLDKNIEINNSTYTIKNIDITPFALCLSIQGSAQSDNIISQALEDLNDGMTKLKAAFHNDTVLGNNNFSFSASGGRQNPDGYTEEDIGYYKVILQFNRPVISNNIDTITIQNEVFEIK